MPWTREVDVIADAHTEGKSRLRISGFSRRNAQVVEDLHY